MPKKIAENYNSGLVKINTEIEYSHGKELSNCRGCTAKAICDQFNEKEQEEIVRKLVSICHHIISTASCPYLMTQAIQALLSVLDYIDATMTTMLEDQEFINIMKIADENAWSI